MREQGTTATQAVTKSVLAVLPLETSRRRKQKSPSGHRAPVAHAERRRVRVRFQHPPCLTVSARLATGPPAAARLPQRLQPIRAKDLGRMSDAHWAVVRRRVTVEVEVRDLSRGREAERRAT